MKFIQTLKFIIVHHKTAEHFKISFPHKNQHGTPETPSFFSQLKPIVPAAFAVPTTSQSGERPTNAAASWQERLICVCQWFLMEEVTCRQ